MKKKKKKEQEQKQKHKIAWLKMQGKRQQVSTFDLSPLKIDIDL